VAVLSEVCATALDTPVIQANNPTLNPTASDTIALRTPFVLRTSGLRAGKSFAMSIDVFLDRSSSTRSAADSRKPLNSCGELSEAHAVTREYINFIL
jgi:hypothetical protein